MLKSICGLVLLALSSIASAEEPVFLLGKLNIAGTTYTQVVFFYDRAVQNMETCEREIYYGRNNQWQYYGHIVKHFRGMSVNANYFCRTSGYNISAWYPQAKYTYVYQLDMRNDDFKVQPFDSYAKCLNDLRKQVKDETHDFFCARSNQEVSKPVTAAL